MSCPRLCKINFKEEAILVGHPVTVIRGYQKNVVHDPFTLAFSGAREAGVRIARQFWSCLEFFPAGGPDSWLSM